MKLGDKPSVSVETIPTGALALDNYLMLELADRKEKEPDAQASTEIKWIRTIIVNAE